MKAYPELIDQKAINEFVNAVETRKNFSRNPDKVFRHIASEVGELDSTMYEVDKLDVEERTDPEGLLNLKNVREFLNKKVGEELLDIIFLCCFMGELYGVDLNGIAPGRMEAIARKYDVRWPIKKQGRNSK